MRHDPDDLADWLALWRIQGIGVSHFRALLDHFGTPGAALRASRAQLTDLGLPREAADSILSREPDLAKPDLEWLAQTGRHALVWTDPRYPERLLEISNPPPVLFVDGDPGVLSDPQIAVVGSRNPTPTGRETAFEFARHLAACGLAITSGMALGIDGAAHRGALDADGVTIAVTGTGLDRVYPRQHRDLAHEIARRGAMVSEFPIGTPARPEHFPRRNRIISGLSLGTLVVEAARKSGSLITARLSAEQGREVFAIPGSIHSPLSRGCHQLIRDGAKLVETAQDILEELGPMACLVPSEAGPGSGEADTSESTPFDSDPQYGRLLECMGFEPTSVDTLVARAGLTAEAVSSMLLLLELHGRVASMSGGLYVRLVPSERDERDRA